MNQVMKKKKTVVTQKGIVPGRGSKKVLPGNKIADSALGFPIVGIGASAGGLATFEAFFSGMPAKSDPGMAFVLVQHLAPNHKSILTDLVKRYTRMQVSEVEDGMPVRINCAYIIPPNHDMAFLNGSLQLLEPSATRGLRLPICAGCKRSAMTRGIGARWKSTSRNTAKPISPIPCARSV